MTIWKLCTKINSTMDFEQHLCKYLNQDEIKKLITSFSEKERKALYLNTNKMSENLFQELFPNVPRHPIVKNGFIFDKNEYEFGKKIYHEQGAYYIQEPSAMLVANFLDPKPGDIVLDLCAAPGGKTIQSALKMQNQGLIIANDLSKSRANILLSNIERLGISNTVITSLDFKNYERFFQNYFDKIILDAPCSGSGMFRKSDEMKKDWTYEKVLKNAAIQKELILMCYSMLKEGGTMVYSTCSYSYEEDEEIIEFLLSKTDAKLIKIPEFKGDFRSNKYPETVHLFPSHFEGEGHYIALIIKPGILQGSKIEKNEIKRSVIGKGNSKEMQTYICPAKLPAKLDELALRPGIFVETKINDKTIPSHHFSHILDASNSIDLTQDEVIKYVKGETINKKCQDGYVFVSYQGINLGVAYSINGILKNYYPKGLRFNASIDLSF